MNISIKVELHFAHSFLFGQKVRAAAAKAMPAVMVRADAPPSMSRSPVLVKAVVLSWIA